MFTNNVNFCFLVLLRKYFSITLYNNQCPSHLSVRVRCSCDAKKKLNHVLTVTSAVARNAGEGMLSLMVGFWWSLCLAGVWSQSAGFCLCVWAGSRREGVFTFYLVF
jgi:hypothetical protein